MLGAAFPRYRRKGGRRSGRIDGTAESPCDQCPSEAFPPISAVERAALREHLVGPLSALGDVSQALLHEDHESVERFGIQAVDDLQLLLHWVGLRDDVIPSGRLAMSRDDLQRAFCRIQSRIQDEEESEADEWAEIEERRKKRSFVANTCDRALARLSES
jgi:hypothetical protein